MYVSPNTLAMHLRVLHQQGFTFIQLDDWLASADNREAVPPRCCAITFDDGWRDNYDHAYPVLSRARAPATIYLVSELVGTRYSFWPSSLARTLAKRGMSMRQIDETIMQYKATRSDEEMRAVIGSLENDAGERDLLSWPEIREMQESGLIRFGSHTRRHTRLRTGVDAGALQDEIIGSRQDIEQQLGAAPQTFCYPNGDTSLEAIQIVRSSYRGAVTTRRGWHSRDCNPFLIRRVGVHEDISDRPAAFLARISGWPGY